MDEEFSKEFSNAVRCSTKYTEQDVHLSRIDEMPPEVQAVESSDEDETHNDSNTVAGCPPLPVYKIGVGGKSSKQEKVMMPQVSPCFPQPPVYSKQPLQLPGKDEKTSVTYDQESSEDNSDGEESDQSVSCRPKKTCPLPSCNARVVHLPRHMHSVHGWSKDSASTVTSRFLLRKKYVFTNGERASAGNRNKKKESCPESKVNTKKPCRGKKLCPFSGCQIITERLPQHLLRRHRLKRDDSKYKKITSLAKVISASTMPQKLLEMKEESEKSFDESLGTWWPQAEERQNSRDSSCPKDIVSPNFQT